MDLGRFTTADRSFDEDTQFLTLGAIYGVREDFDIDIGLKHGLSDPETDTTLLLGIAHRF
jgi:long-subunit fatty acid transport protein